MIQRIAIILGLILFLTFCVAVAHYITRTDVVASSILAHCPTDQCFNEQRATYPYTGRWNEYCSYFPNECK